MSFNCIFLRKGEWKNSKLNECIILENLFMIDEDEIVDKSLIKVFKNPNFSSDIYNIQLCLSHEQWKKDLIDSEWYTKNNIDKLSPIEKISEIDKTFGKIYNIVDEDLNILFEFTGGNVWVYESVKDENYSTNNIIWYKITKKYSTWMPYRDKYLKN